MEVIIIKDFTVVWVAYQKVIAKVEIVVVIDLVEIMVVKLIIVMVEIMVAKLVIAIAG